MHFAETASVYQVIENRATSGLFEGPRLALAASLVQTPDYHAPRPRHLTLYPIELDRGYACLSEIELTHRVFFDCRINSIKPSHKLLYP